MSSEDFLIARRLLPAWFGLAAFLFLVGVAHSHQLHQPLALAVLAILYTALAAACLGGAILLARWGKLGMILGAIGLGAIMFWQAREQTDILHIGARPVASAAAFVLLTLAAGLALWGLPRRVSLPHIAILLFGGVVGVVSIAVTTHAVSPRLHWHLVRHHRAVSALLHGPLHEPIPALTQVVVEPVEWLPTPRSPEPEEHPSETGEKPHVVVVMVDTLRADGLAAWGGAPGLMPRVNELAQRSHLLLDIVANSSWTSPSVASFFTGLQPEQHGLWDNRTTLREENVTLAERFRERGYRTLAVVTNGNVGEELGFDQGFETFLHLKGENAYARADQVRRVVLRQVRALQADRPVFLYVHLMEPHTPYLDAHSPGFWQPYHHRAAYDAELRFLDRELDALIQELRQALPAPRLVLVTSDHGEEFGEHGGFGHGQSLYQELLHVPVILHTESEESSRIEEPLELRDLFHLALDYQPGLSISQWARRHQRAVRCASSYYTPTSLASLYMLRPYATRRLRATFQEDRVQIRSGYGPYLEAYDLETDPHQVHNLAPSSTREIAPLLSECVPWATKPRFSERSEGLAERLRALGYVQ